MSKYLFTIHGTRGSMSVCGKDFIRYGGLTTAFSVSSDDLCVIIDAGSGLQSLSDKLLKMNQLPEIHIFFTHFHLDHIMGLPVFAPFYQAKANIIIHYEINIQCCIDSILQSFFAPPFWPVAFCDLPAKITLDKFSSSSDGIFIKDLLIKSHLLQHSQNTLGYRIVAPGGTSIAILTDYEHVNKKIYDAQYLPEEYPLHVGWGHSTWLEAVSFANDAGVKNLILTHHDRFRTDVELDKIELLAKEKFSRTQVAFDEMHFLI